MIVVRLPMRKKMSLNQFYKIIKKFNQWSSRVYVDGPYLVIEFDVKEK